MQPDDGHQGPKHVVVSQYIVIKLHLSDSCVRLPTLPKVLTHTTEMTQFLDCRLESNLNTKNEEVSNVISDILNGCYKSDAFSVTATVLIDPWGSKRL